MEAYLDNSATTKPSKRVVEAMNEMMSDYFGNPSSLHNLGFEAEKKIEYSREVIAKSLKVDSKEIFFTSGGTESNNMALIGAAMANVRAGKHIITSSIEHASILSCVKFLEDEGFEVDYLPTDSNGIIDLEALKSLIREDTIIVSIMHVNNEIGAIEPIEQACKLVKDLNPRCLVHIDAIQSYGKIRIYPKKIGIDMLSVSGHKIHGPKGSGFLYIKSKTKIKPIIYGGGQELGLRSGTENCYAIYGLGVAVEELYQDFDANVSQLRELKEHFLARIENMEFAHVNGLSDLNSAPHIVSVSFDDVRAEVILHALEERGIYVSAGSACSSNKPATSKTLLAIGIDKKYLDSTVRFSFSKYNTIEEVDYAADALLELVPMLSRFTRR